MALAEVSSLLSAIPVCVYFRCTPEEPVSLSIKGVQHCPYCSLWSTCLPTSVNQEVFNSVVTWFHMDGFSAGIAHIFVRAARFSGDSANASVMAAGHNMT